MEITSVAKSIEEFFKVEIKIKAECDYCDELIHVDCDELIHVDSAYQVLGGEVNKAFKEGWRVKGDNSLVCPACARRKIVNRKDLITKFAEATKIALATLGNEGVAVVTALEKLTEELGIQPQVFDKTHTEYRKAADPNKRRV